MSWKSILSAGLLCIVASPAFAVSSLSIVKAGTNANGFLDASGNWVFKVRITPTGGSSVATEIGIRENTTSELLTATAAAAFDHSDAGLKIFGWEPTWNGNALYSDGLRINNPGGGTPNLEEVFASLGSSVFATNATQDYLTITVQGPSTNGRLSTTLQTLGKYGAGNAQGLIAETVSGSPVSSFISGSTTFTAKQADANLDNSIDGADFNAWLFSAGTQWFNGDFNDDNSIDGADFNLWLFAPGGAGGIAIPEPTSGLLVVLGSLMMAAYRRNR